MGKVFKYNYSAGNDDVKFYGSKVNKKKAEPNSGCPPLLFMIFSILNSQEIWDVFWHMSSLIWKTINLKAAKHCANCKQQMDKL